MKPLAILLTLLAAAACALSAPGQRTTARGLKTQARPARPVYAAELDTLAADTTMVSFAGYEKTLRATRETIFVTNHTGRDACEARFTIRYIDAAGREIHRRGVAARADYAAGATTRVDIPSWDTQKTFYYSPGPRPRVKATPYTVAVTPDTLILLPTCTP